MRLAVIHNLDAPEVLQRFGASNREIIHRSTVEGVIRGLQQAGHAVTLMDGDERLSSRLRSFLAAAAADGEEAMAFNIAYGVQGRDRYAHVPALLEMLGVPYVGSGPSSHSWCLDKAHAKTMLIGAGIPTPAFGVMTAVGQPLPDLGFPVIAKPKCEAGSIGLTMCHDHAGLEDAVARLLEDFEQAVLVEQYIEGREIYVGVLGNGARVETFPSVELEFREGDHLLHQADKDAAHAGRPLRDLRVVAPAQIPDILDRHVRRLARRAFEVLECEDLARIDLRVDDDDRPWVLELNSIPGLDEDGPYALGAKAAGLSFPDLLDRIVQEARRRYRDAWHPDLVPRPLHAVEVPDA